MYDGCQYMDRTLWNFPKACYLGRNLSENSYKCRVQGWYLLNESLFLVLYLRNVQVGVLLRWPLSVSTGIPRSLAKRIGVIVKSCQKSFNSSPRSYHRFTKTVHVIIGYHRGIREFVESRFDKHHIPVFGQWHVRNFINTLTPLM